MAQDDSNSPTPGVVGPHSEFIKLVSKDDFEFFVDRRKTAAASGTISRMLEAPLEDGGNNQFDNTIHLESLPSHVLVDVCRYINYHAWYSAEGIEVPDFDIALENVVELLVAADFLDC